MDKMYYIVESMDSRWTRCIILLSLWTADGQDVLYCLVYGQPMDMMYYIVETMDNRWTRRIILLSL